MNHKIITYFVKIGYSFKKDALGYYFDKGFNRLSIMKVGPIFNCYHNKFNGNKFILINSKLNVMNEQEVFDWMKSQDV